MSEPVTDPVTDAEIAAFLEGRLDGAAGDRVAAALEADPAVAARAEALAAAPGATAQDEALRDAYAAALAEPVPPRLAAAVLGAPGKVAAFPARRRVWAPAAMAASLALIVGFGAGRLGLPGETAAPPQAQAALSVGMAPEAAAAAFQTLASGQRAGGLALAGSFLAGDGRACREFETLDAGGAVAALGVACRAREAGWRVLALTEAPAGAAAGGGFAPASGAGGDPMAGVLDALGAGPQLSPDEEAALIAGGWE